MVLISSKKSVPPEAASNSPTWSATAPVKAPFTWPKRCDSSRSGGRFELLTVTNGASERGPCWWIASAVSSLPVPLSPVIRTVVRAGATCSITR